MVDIMDMEDIFDQHLLQFIKDLNIRKVIVRRLIREVKDFVEGQQTIACANCKGYKFKNLDSTKR
jgi:hypothetical protein